MKPTIAIATCLKAPTLTPSDQRLEAALRNRGCDVLVAPWNADFHPFERADVTIIRSTWDYHLHPNEFREWINRFHTSHTILNSANLVLWNMTKAYLFELQQNGVQIAPLRQVEPNADEIQLAIDDLNIATAVVKPLIGATASGLSLVEQNDRNAIERAAEKLRGPGLVQKFLPEITTSGELSLIFVDGQYSHSIRKTPKHGDIRVQTEFGGLNEKVLPSSQTVCECQKVIEACPEIPVYARVDVVYHDEATHLMELELVEPDLFLKFSDDAPDKLSNAILRRV